MDDTLNSGHYALVVAEALSLHPDIKFAKNVRDSLVEFQFKDESIFRYMDIEKLGSFANQEPQDETTQDGEAS